MTTLKRYEAGQWETVGQAIYNSGPAASLGYAEITADTATTTSSADAGISITITVPAGRRIRLTAEALLIGNTDSAGARLMIMEGANILRLADAGMTGAKQEAVHTDIIITPSAGTHTYRVVYSVWTGGGTVKIGANGQYPAYLLAEDITGSTLPYDPASVPVGLLAQAQVTANQSSITTEVDLTGLSVNVVVPAGRVLKIIGTAYYTNSGAAGYDILKIYQDGVQIDEKAEPANTAAHGVVSIAIVSPSAGSHTYKLRGTTTGGTALLNASATFPAFITVEDITPTPVASIGAPGSTLGYAEKVTDQNSIGTSNTDIIGLTVTVTVPAGRRLRISARTLLEQRTSAGLNFFFIAEDGVQIAESLQSQGLDEYWPAEVAVVRTPTAGTHVYKVYAKTSANTTDVLAQPSYPGYILVEDITGSVWPEGSSVTAGMVASEAWQPWTPTLANLTIGNGTVAANFVKIGRTVSYRFLFTLGSTSAVGANPTITLPYPPVAAGYPGQDPQIGDSAFRDNGVITYRGSMRWTGTGSVASFITLKSDGTYLSEAAVSSTAPFTFGTADAIFAWGTYEAAS